MILAFQRAGRQAPISGLAASVGNYTRPVTILGGANIDSLNGLIAAKLPIACTGTGRHIDPPMAVRLAGFINTICVIWHDVGTMYHDINPNFWPDLASGGRPGTGRRGAPARQAGGQKCQGTDHGTVPTPGCVLGSKIKKKERVNPHQVHTRHLWPPAARRPMTRTTHDP